jgi:lipopolysaccharide/colanic/teichoic acid biosynthesis glycosyltransferase
MLFARADRGPWLYRERRISRGREFDLLKFRALRRDVLERQNGTEAHARLLEADSGNLTWAGRRILKPWYLDELPQLFNVLKGEMSLVGPRPERPVFVEQFRREIPRYMLRHKVKSGLTGWAQVNGWRGNTSLEERIKYDLEYIERWSLAFDLKILWLTPWRGFRGTNAY